MNIKKSNINEIAYGKVPPQAVEVEEAVLGALMLEAETFESIAGIIGTTSFYKVEHQKIFDTIKSIVSENKPVDLLTVTQALKDRGKLDEVGGPGEITRLTSKVASAAHIESHARIIAEKHYLRESIRRATELNEISYSDEDVELITDQWKVAVEELEDIFSVADTGTHIGPVMKNTILGMQENAAKASEGKTPGIPTGFVGLDLNTGGWKGGNLLVMAARPGVGKTSLALHFALAAAKAGYWVNFFSLEMNKEDLARILIATVSGVYRSDIRDGYIQNKDWQKINQAVALLEKLPIIFRDASGMNVNQIKSAIRKNKKNGRCDFAIVDYMQLVKSSSPKAIRELEVSEISRTLKTVALAENIPILALSQLNREADGQMPRLSHLRESGAIEQDADIVIFLVTNENKIRFSVAKHRRGRLCDIDLYHNDEMTAFQEHPFNDETMDPINPDNHIEPVSNNGTPF